MAMQKILSNYLYLFRKLNRSDPKLFVYSAFMVAVGTALPLCGVMFPKAVVWAVSQEGSTLALLALVLVFFFLINGFCSAVWTYMNRRNGFYLTNFGFKLKEDIQAITMRMPFSMTEDPKVLDEIRLAKECIGRTQPAIETFCGCASAILLLSGYIVLLLRLDPRILLVFLICSFLQILILQRSKQKKAGLREEKAGVERRKNYLFQTMFDYRCGKELRLFAMDGILRRKYLGSCRERQTILTRFERYQTAGEMAGALLRAVCELTIYLSLLFFYLEEGLSADTFVMYIGVAASFQNVSKDLADAVSDLIYHHVSIEDYRRFVEGKSTLARESCEASGRLSPSTEPPSFGRASIVFEDVSFSYPGSAVKVLDHVSFTLEPGCHASIVGENGAGKSTLVRLLCRFYPPDEGRILLNGTDIQEWEPREYLRRISGVFQESRLFAATLEENICPNQKADPDRMWEALRMAGMEEKIRRLPRQEKSNVLKYLYDDGVEFSGGEKQRLCLARAIYKNGDLLLLDEPTAALDALAEKEIYESFDRISRGRTVLFISHRLNSNRLCDKVIFLEKGRILDQGSHEDLMDRCPPYRDMYRLQARYYIRSQKEDAQ